MTKNVPKTPDEALAHIQAAVAEGGVEFADDSLTAQVDEYVQRIFHAIRMVEKGKPPKRPIWASDGATIGWVLPCDESGHVNDEGRRILAETALGLGIPLSPDDTWLEAALRLRDKESGQELRS